MKISCLCASNDEIHILRKIIEYGSIFWIAAFCVYTVRHGLNKKLIENVFNSYREKLIGNLRCAVIFNLILLLGIVFLSKALLNYREIEITSNEDAELILNDQISQQIFLGKLEKDKSTRVRLKVGQRHLVARHKDSDEPLKIKILPIWKSAKLKRTKITFTNSSNRSTDPITITDETIAESPTFNTLFNPHRVEVGQNDFPISFSMNCDAMEITFLKPNGCDLRYTKNFKSPTEEKLSKFNGEHQLSLATKPGERYHLDEGCIFLHVPEKTLFVEYKIKVRGKGKVTFNLNRKKEICTEESNRKRFKVRVRNQNIIKSYVSSPERKPVFVKSNIGRFQSARLHINPGDSVKFRAIGYWATYNTNLDEQKQKLSEEKMEKIFGPGGDKEHDGDVGFYTREGALRGQLLGFLSSSNREDLVVSKSSLDNVFRIGQYREVDFNEIKGRRYLYFIMNGGKLKADNSPVVTSFKDHVGGIKVYMTVKRVKKNYEFSRAEN